MITAQSIKHDNDCFSRNFFAKISRFGRFKKYVIKIVDIFNIRNTFKVSIKILMNVVLDNGEKSEYGILKFDSISWLFQRLLVFFVSSYAVVRRDPNEFHPHARVLNTIVQ